MRKFAISLGLAMTFVAGTAAAQTTWEMATPYPEAEFHTKNIHMFVQEFEEATEGEIKINVHSGQSLFNHPEIPRAVRTQQVQLGEIMMANLVNEDSMFAADNLPFVIDSYDSAWELWEAQRPFVEARMDKRGLKLLYAVPWPPQGFFTNKEIDSVDDMAGLKFRTYNSLTGEMAERMGAIPTTIEAVEIPQAFSTGIVDAMVTAAATGVRTKAWDFSNYYYDVQAWMPKNMVFINKNVFDHLPEDQQQKLLDAATQAEARGWEMSQEILDSSTAELAEEMTVNAPTKEFRQQLNEIGEIMAEGWAQDAGPDGEALLDALQ